MVDSHHLSLDDECQLYHACFYHSDQPHVSPVIHHRPHSNTSYGPPQVCHRCGGAGHFAFHCSAPIPSISELEAIEEMNYGRHLMRASRTGTWERDEFGLFQKDGANCSPIPSTVTKNGTTEPLNWTTSRFCLNCGRAGHHFSRCEQTPFPELLDQMNETYGVHDGKYTEEQWRFLTSIWEDKKKKPSEK
jgi:hypothetical protein